MFFAYHTHMKKILISSATVITAFALMSGVAFASISSGYNGGDRSHNGSGWIGLCQSRLGC